MSFILYTIEVRVTAQFIKSVLWGSKDRAEWFSALYIKIEQASNRITCSTMSCGGGGENRTRVQKLSIPASTCVANSLSSYRQPCKLAMPVAGQLLSFAPAVTTPAGTSSYDMSLPSIAGPGLEANRSQRLTGNQAARAKRSSLAFIFL